MSQQDSTATPPGAHAPYGGPRTGLSGRGARFFDWMRGLGIARADGWLGGVCAGVAYRLGIDPLIVRGIVAVAAVLGAPLLLIYAIAWALLPDGDGRIHLQRLFDGEFEPPMVAIGVMVLLSLVPWASGLWWFDGPFWHLPAWGDLVGRVLWTLVVLGAGIALIVLAVRNSPTSASTPTSPTAPAPPTAPPGHPQSADASPAAPAADGPAQAPGAAAAAGAARSSVPTVSLASEPVAPPAPQADASTEAVADWQERQAQWRAEHAEWKRRLDEDMRTVRAQRRTELRAQAAAASADAAARRIAYRTANPRIGAAVGWLAVGLSLVAGSVTAIIWMQIPEISRYASAAALSAGTLVLAVTVFIAGLARRRSGFLIFLAILLAVLTTAATVAAGSSAHAFLPAAGAFDGTWSR